MKSLVAIVENIFANTFRGHEAHLHGSKVPERSRRFAMESLETRVLLSADPVVLPALIDQPEPTTEERVVLPWEDSGVSGLGTTDADSGDEGEEDGGDFIEPEAYDEIYGPFDYDTFLDEDANGPLGGQGGAVDPSPAADVLANNNAGASGTANFTQSETSVIAFGNTVLIAFNDSGSVSGGTNKFTGFARSTDGGLTFTDGGVLPTNSVGDVGDPVLARNNTTGRTYFATLQFSGSGIAVFHSDDDGLTWSAPAQGAPGKSDFQDKEWIGVDNFAGSGNGNVYLVERDFGPGNGIYFFRSTDNGNTFGPTGGTLIASGSQGAFVTVGSDHSVYAFWFAGATIQMRKSTDQGLSFGPAVTVAGGLVGGSNGDLALTGIRQGTATASGFRSNEFPHAAVNPVNGNIYVTYSNDGPGVDRGDVFVVQSTNGGAAWSAPFKVNDDTTTTDQWQPTLAVTPGGDKLGIFYYSRQEDPTGNNLFKYYGRIAGISGPTLTFAPSFPISDTPSLPEFGRDALINSTYMGDYDTAYATPGFFHVSWSDSRSDLPNGAGRRDPNVYYKAIDLGLTVLTTTPADDSVVSSIPLDYVVNFSDPIQIATVNATDFTVDGVVANSFIVNTSTQVKFHFDSSPFSTQGLHTIALAAGAILRASDGDTLAAFSNGFRYDALSLQVTGTVPSVSGVFTVPGPFTYDVNFDVRFNEAVDPASVQTWDLVLDGIDGAFVSAATVLPGNMTARFTLSGITQGLLTANITSGAILDAFGNLGTAFSSSGAYSVDVDTVSYPTPLTAEDPAGSLIYDPSLTGFISFASDVDSFTINVDPGQTISLILTPTSPGLHPRIELFDPNNISQGFAVAPAAGQIAAIETMPADLGGEYTFAVSGAGGTIGSYTLQVILNSAFEREGKVADSNNTLSTTTTGIVQTINAVDSGWIQSDGTHDAFNNNYFVGQLTTTSQSRDYFGFNLSASTPTIVGAELRLFNPVNGYSSPDTTETYTLFDVSQTPAGLDATRVAGDMTGIAIYGDLGSGTAYGTRIVSAADNNKTVAIALNGAAVAALNAAIGSTISFGGAITTLAGSFPQWMFGFTSGALGTVQLVLQTASVSSAENIDSSFLTLSTPQASAQRGAVLGQTDFSTNYVATAMPFAFEDISTTGTLITPLTNQDNVSVGIFPSGFTFPFYGVNNTTVYVSSNGLLTFGGSNSSFDNTNLTVSPSQPAIAPFWDDLHTGGGVSGSNVFYQVIGGGPNRHLTIQWNKVRFASGGAAGDTLTFEAQLFQNGRIRFNYLDLVSDAAAGNNGASATVGMKAAGTQDPDRLLLAFNNGPNALVGTGKSIQITPGIPTPDYYAFTLNDGETATLAATLLAPGNPLLTLELRDSSDAILATGIGPSATLTKVISDFAVVTGGTYYARVTGNNGTISTPYSLVVTRNAAFETELNNTPDTAQILTGAQEGVLGALFAQIPVNAADSGWITTDGTHTATNNNYIVGQLLFNNNPLSEYRNYATFALSPATPKIIGAELRLFNPGPPRSFLPGYTSPDLTETYTLFDVAPATQADLDVTRGAGDTRGMAIHDNLGTGTVYGTRVVSAADNNTSVAIPLNDDAVAALNAAIGSMISFGGAITTLAGTAQQTMFGFTNGAPGTVRLLLQTVANDWYSITLPDTANAVRLDTSTPGDGPGEPVNTLNSRIELYDSTGTTLVASGVTGPDGRNESIVVTGLTPGATYKVLVTSEGDTSGEYFLTRNFNFSPVLTDMAVASPINENDTAMLTGAFSDLDTLDTHTVVINWGTGEGSTTLNLAAGVLTFSATHQYLDENPTGTPSDVYPVSVTLTDNHFGSDSASVNLTVNNVAPDVTLSGPSSGVRGQALVFSGSFTDVGTLDTHQVRWDFGDGTVIDFHATTDLDALTPPAHIYAANGVYTLTLSIRDDDTGLTSVSNTVTTASVAIQADPGDSTKTALVVGGTTGNDTIVFNPQGNLGDIKVSINGVSQGVFRPTGHIIAFGQAGDDDIQVAGSIGLDAWLYGDAGNDRLKGGAGVSLLLGGDGDDELLGGKGRSILIGGRGKDRLVGGSGEDILIGGFTTYDSNILFCCNVTDGWKSTVDTYAVRVARLRLLLNDDTVIDDGEADRLTGSSSLDWFFDSLGDVITDQHDGEVVG